MSSPPQIFDRQLYLARQPKASSAATDLLRQRMAEELSDRLSVINHQFDRALLIAPPALDLSAELLASGKFGQVISQPPTAAEDLDLAPLSLDAVISLLDLHAVNDVPGYLAQVARALRPDGLAMLAFFAGDTLTELRQAWLAAESELTDGATPRVAPMIDLRESGALLQRAGLALPVSDLDRLTLRYATALDLMREIKSLGLSNCLKGRSSRFTARQLLVQAASHYHTDHADPDGRVRATLDIAWAMAWKPHPSQQQPLKPGSAKARLIDALKP